MDKSIHYSETILKMLEKINITQKLSEIYISHIITILITVFSIGYRGKTVDFETHSDHHRTTTAHFLNKGKWNETVIEDTIKKEVISIVYGEAQRTGKPTIAPVISYLLCDSWYVCDKVMNSFLSRGFYTIVALKTNRIVFILTG